VGIVSQIQIRCARCNRRLADLINEVQAGEALIELKCPRCGLPHLEVVRTREDSGENSASWPVAAVRYSALEGGSQTSQATEREVLRKAVVNLRAPERAFKRSE
jgi:phage FluMu protein Com